MSASAIWTVHCNSCGHWAYQSDTRAEAEAVARYNGWRVETRPQGGRNFCPACLTEANAVLAEAVDHD